MPEPNALTSANIQSTNTSNSLPVFDKSVDYVAKVEEQGRLLNLVQALHEESSQEYLSMFRQVVRQQKRLTKIVAQNGEKLL